MKITKVIVILFVIIQAQLISCKSDEHSKKHILLGYWKFKTGDKVEYKNVDYDDSKWDSIGTDRPWEDQGYQNYDGYAWYRKRVFIPSSLKETLDSENLEIFLGRVDDSDQVYLNGSILGENGKILDANTPADTIFKQFGNISIDKKYILSVNDKRILWDKVNLISVRVFDKNGRGGIHYNINPFIGLKGFEDSVSFQNDKFYNVDDKGKVDTTIFIKNSSSANLSGKLSIVAENITTGNTIYEQNLQIKLNAGEKQPIPVALPISLDPVNVSFIYQDTTLKTSVYDFTIPYSLIR